MGLSRSRGNTVQRGRLCRLLTAPWVLGVEGVSAPSTSTVMGEADATPGVEAACVMGVPTSRVGEPVAADAAADTAPAPPPALLLLLTRRCDVGVAGGGPAATVAAAAEAWLVVAEVLTARARPPCVRLTPCTETRELHWWYRVAVVKGGVVLGRGEAKVAPDDVAAAAGAAGIAAGVAAAGADDMVAPADTVATWLSALSV